MGPLMQMFRQGQMGYQMPQERLQPMQQPAVMGMNRKVGPGGAPPPMMAAPQPGGLAQLLANSRRPVSAHVNRMRPAVAAPTGGAMPGLMPGAR